MTSSSVRGAGIPRFGLRRPVTIGVLFVALLVLGGIAYRSIGLELIPSGFTPPFLYVQVPTLRSSPADVEQRMALPLEEMLATVRNLETLGTRVRGNSTSFMMEFSDGTDMDVAYNQVRDRIERVLPTLGDDVGQYFIWKYNPADDAVLWFAVGVGSDVENPGWTIDNLVVPAFERIPGVSRVETYGVPQRVVSVQVDERLVSAAGLSMAELIERLSQDNFALSAGTIEDGERTWPLRMVARYGSLEEVREIPVGNGLRLGDIATVEVQDRAERALYRIDGRRSIMLGAYKESTANTVDVAREVRRVGRQIIEEDPRLGSVEFAFLFDQGAMIEDSIDNLQQTALWGGAFAVAILFFFLRRLGMTLLVTLAIPCSLLMTIVFMYFTGRSLNLFSLTGLMLAVGMVVDNAIVVVESIQARLLEGDSPKRAALAGAAEVSLAVLVATLTTVVVFLPLIFMSGNETLSFYLSNIGLPVCVSLLASLVVSLLFLPLATTMVLRAEAPPRVRVVEWITARYVGVLRWTLAHRAEACLCGVAAFASIMVPMESVSQTDQSEPNINDVRFILTVPDEYSWQEKVDIVLAYEAALEAERETLSIEHIQVRMNSGNSRPQVRIFLADPDERTLERDEIIEHATDVLPQFPGVSWSLRWGGTGANDAVTVRVVGPDSARLAELSAEVARRLRMIDGVTSVQSEGEDASQSEIQFRVDAERSLRLGLNAMTVGGTIDFALRGRQLPSYHGGGEELPMLIEGDLERVDEVDEIQRMPMPSMVDNVVLADVTRSQMRPGYGSIDREDRRTVASITIATSRDDLDVLRGEILTVMRDFDWPRGYGLELGNRFEDLESGARERNLALLLAIVSVFLLMGVLFESITLPFSILLSIPFAFTGVFWMLWATDTKLDMMAGVGLIILIGIVVNNAIVLVDRVSELRRQGVDRTDAILSAGSSRLRPIVMTALTTIFGLIPMAIGSSSLIGIPYNPLGRAVIGGLLASTVLTLFVVPLFYTLIDDTRRWFGAWWRATSG